VDAWRVYWGEKPKIIFIDTLATATRGADENSGKDMGFVLANIAILEEEVGCHVCLVHHMNADATKLRGHTSLHADVDQVINVTLDKETATREAVLVKQKDGEDGLVQKFALTPIEVDTHPRTGKTITSCVVTSVSERDSLKSQREREGFNPTPAERLMLSVLFRATREHGALIAGDEDPALLPIEAIGWHAVEWSHIVDVWVKMDITEKEDVSRDALRMRWKRNTQRLVDQGIIFTTRLSSGGWVWWGGKPVRGFRWTYSGRRLDLVEMANAERTFSEQKPHDFRTTSEQPSDMSPGMRDMFADPEIDF
jgi:hypothetical protein